MKDIHLLFLFIAIPTILYADWQGFRWMRGRVQTLNPRVMRFLHLLVYGALSGIIGTGLVMFLKYSDWLLSTPAFFVKMFFVLVLVINSFLIGRHMHVATEKPFAELNANEKRWILMSGAVSTIGWIGAILCGLSIG